MRAGEIIELNTFLAVAEESRFAAAAVRLGVTASAVSQSIRRLETRLGVALLRRTTRSVALTEAGAALLAEVKPALDRLAGAEPALGALPGRPAGGRLRISVPAVAMELLVAPILSGFERDHPDVRLDLVVEDRLTDLVARRYDAVIRRGELLEQDMIARRLSPDDHLVLVASQGFLDTRAPPLHPRDLASTRIVISRPRSAALAPWSLTNGGDIARVTGPSRLTVESALAARQWAMAGLGVALLARSFVAKALVDGSLQRILPEWHWPIAGFHLMYARRGDMSASLLAFTNALARQNPGDAKR